MTAAQAPDGLSSTVPLSSIPNLRVSAVYDNGLSDAYVTSSNETLPAQRVLDAIVRLNMYLADELSKGGKKITLDKSTVQHGAAAMLKHKSYGKIVLAWIDDFHIVGQLEVKRTFEVWYSRAYCYVDNFVVDANFHGKGVGSELLRYVARDAHLEQEDRVRLYVDTHNDHAREFYLHRGFDPVGQLMELSIMELDVERKS